MFAHRSRSSTAMDLRVMRIAAADRNRAGMQVTIADMPAFLADVSRSAAGEFEHSRQTAESNA